MEYEIVGQVMPLVQLTLKSGESVRCQSGAMKWMDPDIGMDTQMVGGVGGMLKHRFMGESGFMGMKNSFFGGEGLFLTTLTGPGRVWLQTMSIQSLARELHPFLSRKSGS